MRIGIKSAVAIAAVVMLGVSGCSGAGGQTAPSSSTKPAASAQPTTAESAFQAGVDADQAVFDAIEASLIDQGYTVRDVFGFVYDAPDGKVTAANVLLVSNGGVCLYSFEVRLDGKGHWVVYDEDGNPLNKQAFDKAAKAQKPFSGAVSSDCSFK